MAKVLLVEDDSNLREIYAARLTAETYEVIAAADGEEALAKAVKEKPDLIILDVMMPKISGFDVLDILRSTPETKEAKIIMMTALSETTDRERGQRLGANRYLVKSQVTLEDVIANVHELLDENNSSAPVASSATGVVAAADNNSIIGGTMATPEPQTSVPSDDQSSTATPSASPAAPMAPTPAMDEPAMPASTPMTPSMSPADTTSDTTPMDNSALVASDWPSSSSTPTPMPEPANTMPTEEPMQPLPSQPTMPAEDIPAAPPTMAPAQATDMATAGLTNGTAPAEPTSAPMTPTDTTAAPTPTVTPAPAAPPAETAANSPAPGDVIAPGGNDTTDKPNPNDIAL